ncbi:MAG: cobA [Paenibacillaceae bacterium]|jgi:uroporphyrinogen III methyltransferase/synthase|nr:cobA [Paenibacillaceae bacterium]
MSDRVGDGRLEAAHKPLSGKRVLVTRSQSQASELAHKIEELGGTAIEFPVIRLQAPTDAVTVKELDAALARLGDFSWVIFTSVNGVEYFIRHLRDRGKDIQELGKAKIAVVGKKTEAALLRCGVAAQVIPVQSQQEGLVEAMLPWLQACQEALLPTSNLARDVLPQKLEKRGVRVTTIHVYENVPSSEGGSAALELLQAGAIDAITFTSSSTVKNLLWALNDLGAKNPLELLRQAKIVCIGPITATTAAEAGLIVDAVAEEASIESLIQAL